MEEITIKDSSKAPCLPRRDPGLLSKIEAEAQLPWEEQDSITTSVKTQQCNSSSRLQQLSHLYSNRRFNLITWAMVLWLQGATTNAMKTFYVLC